MKEGTVLLKHDGSPSPEELKKINCYSRRELSPGEVYTFSVLLCDNEIDRDCERFTVDALKKLSGLFTGKTGIFDHNPKGEKQTARIYNASVMTDSGKTTKAGEPYTYLKASAYMVRTKANEDLILEIDAGIKKEVSVGCSIASVTCSVCGADLKREGCVHRKGDIIDGKVCHTVLDKPTDAYEWSFVAVPAQPAAGVVKGFSGAVARGEDLLLKALEAANSELILTEAEQKILFSAFEKSKASVLLEHRFREDLIKEIGSLCYLTENEAVSEIVKTCVPKLSFDELFTLREKYRRRYNEQFPLTPQLLGCAADKREEQNDFLI